MGNPQMNAVHPVMAPAVPSCQLPSSKCRSSGGNGLEGDCPLPSRHMETTFEIDLDGRKITIETGKLAKQANGSVVVRSGDSVVLVTACMADQAKPGAGFFPLTADYREHTY